MSLSTKILFLVGEREFEKWDVKLRRMIPWYVRGRRRKILLIRCKRIAEMKAVLKMERMDSIQISIRNLIEEINKKDIGGRIVLMGGL